ncbi:PDZ domain-containing protein [Haematococcus lacustris]|uniref:PDZ domain-containing protein n=1 Tax=Haematococcus lacustris TaxID=44745 RepID=A0A699Z139_HAELA|nr:PDZ domain-containing protein [Haematococcus lacustris]
MRCGATSGPKSWSVDPLRLRCTPTLNQHISHIAVSVGSSRLHRGNVARSTRSAVVVAASNGARPDAPVTAFRYPGEHNLELSEYMVVLEQPLGLTLAPDPLSGKITIQAIQEGSPAAQCQMIQVGSGL